MPNTQCQTSPHIPVISGQSIFRKIVSYLVVISLTFSPLAAYPSSAASVNDQEYRAALSRLDEVMALLTQLRSHIDRSQFETDALLEKLNFDADEIVKFVTEEIDFEQYPGLLRGTQGTLMSRGGNSLDQSVLLSALLNDAGYEASIKRTSLTDNQAAYLLQQLSFQRANLLPLEDNDTSKNLLRKMLATVNLPKEKVEAFVKMVFSQRDNSASQVFHKADTDVAFINSILKVNNQELKERDISNQLLSEAKDYFWVEYRLGSADPFISAHPALGSNIKGFSGLKALETFKGKIPEKLQHRFRFQVFSEQKTGNKLTVTPLMKPWERPAANLIGKRLSFNNHPDGLKKILELRDPAKVAKDTRFIMPVFKADNASASEMDLFDLNGTVMDLSILKMGGGPFAALFQNLGNKMESALQAMETGGKKDEDYRALSAQWIEYTLIAPDGKEKRLKRYTLNRISAENRLSGNHKIDKYQSREEVIWKLAESSEFLVSPGSYPEAYIFDRYLQRITAARDGLEMAIYSAYFPDKKPAYTSKQVSAFNDHPALWLMAAIDTDILAVQAVRKYQHEPSLLIVNSGIAFGKQEHRNRFTVDIANPGQRLVKKAGDKFFTAPQAAVLSGAWATQLEEVNFRSSGTPSKEQWSTRRAVQLAKEKQIAVKLLLPENQQALNELQDIESETRQAIRRDLNNGYIVIIPERSAGTDKRGAWWRIHPDTGETLGMISTGQGGVVTEYIIKTTLISLLLSATLSAGGLAGCLSSNKFSPTGCFKSAGIGFALGFALGVAIGLVLYAVIPETVAVGGGVLVSGANIADVLAFSGGLVLDAMEAGGLGPVSQVLPSCLD